MTRLGSDRPRSQLATGEMPFGPEFTDHNVMIMITEGRRPKPRSIDAPGMTPEVWKIAQKCWHKTAEERPEVNTVLRSLENIANSGMCAHKADFCPEWEP